MAHWIRSIFLTQAHYLPLSQSKLSLCSMYRMYSYIYTSLPMQVEIKGGGNKPFCFPQNVNIVMIVKTRDLVFIAAIPVGFQIVTQKQGDALIL